MKLRGAVIGVGYLGTFHGQKYRDLCQNRFQNQIEFVGVCDVNAEQAKKVASDLGVTAFFDPQELIGKVDLVSIATVTSSHFEMAKLFLENGIHVNVEKPMTVTTVEAETLVAMAKAKKLTLCVGHSERFNPAFQAMKSEIKKISHMDLQRHAPYKSRGAEVSVVHDLMIHDIDLALSLDSSSCQVIRAEGGALLSKTLDWANADLHFSSGATAHISVSRMAPQMTRVLKVIEASCCHEVNFQTGDWSLLSPTTPDLGLKIEVKNCGKGDNLKLETEAYFQAVLNQAPSAITGEDGRRALRIVEQVIAKVATNKFGLNQ